MAWEARVGAWIAMVEFCIVAYFLSFIGIGDDGGWKEQGWCMVCDDWFLHFCMSLRWHWVMVGF